MRDRSSVANALGATLYVPASKSNLWSAVSRASSQGATSVVLCLEDAIADSEVAFGVSQIAELLGTPVCRDLPAIFVRIRTEDQIVQIASIDRDEVLAGFVLPKFAAGRSQDSFFSVAAANSARQNPLYAMPILETPALADPRVRIGELEAVVDLLAQHPDLTVAVRIGATDIAGALGLRRSAGLTSYDIGIVRDVVTDIRAIVGSSTDLVPAVSGCAWEFFPPSVGGTSVPSLSDLAVLIREVSLDKANGLIGKTVVHPQQVPVINALLTVTHEEFSDSVKILSDCNGGVSRSEYRNKMNEHRPHWGWALAIKARAAAFGVLAPHVTWVDLLHELQPGVWIA